MKKLLSFLLVFSLASLANATVIDVVTVGIGSLGHTGASTDPLAHGETIAIKIVLNADPNPTWYYGGGYPAYDGYWLSRMDLGLHVSGGGILFENGTMAHNAGFGTWTEPEPAIVNNQIEYMIGSVGGDGIQGQADLVWNLVIRAGFGQAVLDLSLHGLSQYQDGPESLAVSGHGWVTMVEGDLGDLVLHMDQVPEPATIALLGVGGLALLRRRK